MFDTLFQNRVDPLARTYKESLQNCDLRNTHAQQQIIKKWAKSKEFAGMDEEERRERFETISALKPWAEDIMVAGDRLFDIFEPDRSFPVHQLIGLQFHEERLPFETIFISLGKRRNLIVDAKDGIFFEGAYVRQSMEDGTATFDVILVCNDPKFVDEDENIGDMLEGLTRFYHVKIPAGRPLEAATNTVSHGCDPSVVGDRFAVVAGMRLAANAILYLSQPKIDAHVDYDPGAPRKMAQKAKFMDYAARSELDWRGYPSITYLGRKPTSSLPFQDEQETRRTAALQDYSAYPCLSVR